MAQVRVYDVAISFAGEDRPLAEAIAQGLKAARVRVFYDGFEKYDLWGKDLDELLANLYQQARFSVPLISQHYVNKRWPKHEWKSMRAASLEDERERILPIRLDESEIPALLHTVGD